MSRFGLESVAAYERLIDLSPGVFFRQRADFSFEYITRAIEDWSGFPANEWLREPNLLDLLIYTSDAAALSDHLARCSKTGDEAQMAFRIRNRTTGRITHIAERRRAIRDSSGTLTGFEGFWMDVSAAALQSRQLDAASWDRTFGMITLGATHDLNNKLTGIVASSDLYLAEMAKDHPLFDGLQIVRQTALEASQLLHQVATLHQARPGSREHIDLNQFLTANLEILRRVVSSRVKLEASFQKEPLAICVDKVRLQQLIIGWVLQAAPRMPRRGKLTLQTSRDVRDGLPVITLTIADTGSEVAVQTIKAPAINETVEGQLLNQFTAFATSHGGSTRVESLPGGTRLEICFPPADFSQPSGPVEQPGKKWALIVSQAPDQLGEVMRLLETHGLFSVVASMPWDAQLNPNWFHWDAILIHGSGAFAANQLETLRARKSSLKTIIYLSETDPAELGSLSTAADLLIVPDMAQGRVIEKINALLT